MTHSDRRVLRIPSDDTSAYAKLLELRLLVGTSGERMRRMGE